MANNRFDFDEYMQGLPTLHELEEGDVIDFVSMVRDECTALGLPHTTGVRCAPTTGVNNTNKEMS